MNQPIEPHEERRLIAAAAVNGAADADAFRRLYDHYLPRIYAYVGYRVGPVEDVEDVTAEVFVKMTGGLGRFVWRGPGSFSAWLFRITHNEVAAHYRRPESRMNNLPLDASPELYDEQPAANPGPESAERATLIRELLNDLPPRRQEVILLKYFGGLRNREIARILELDERTVASHLSRGLDELRRRWSEATLEDARGEKR